MYIVEDSWGAPQCGVEVKEFETYDEMFDYLYATEGLVQRINEGYAILKEGK